MYFLLISQPDAGWAALHSVAWPSGICAAPESSGALRIVQDLWDGLQCPQLGVKCQILPCLEGSWETSLWALLRARAAVDPCGCLLSCRVSSSWVGPVHVRLTSSLTPAREGRGACRPESSPQIRSGWVFPLKLVCELGTQFIGVYPEDATLCVPTSETTNVDPDPKLFFKGWFQGHLH